MSYKPLPPITESHDELRERLRATRDSQLRQRLQLLVLVKEEAVTTRQAAAEHLMRHRNTISRWLYDYEQGGIDRLLTRKPIGKPAGQRTLPGPVFEALKARLGTDEGFASYVAIQHWLHDEYGLVIPYKTVHQIVRYSLKAKLKRARPVHPKKA